MGCSTSSMSETAETNSAVSRGMTPMKDVPIRKLYQLKEVNEGSPTNEASGPAETESGKSFPLLSDVMKNVTSHLSPQRPSSRSESATSVNSEEENLKRTPSKLPEDLSSPRSRSSSVNSAGVSTSKTISIKSISPQNKATTASARSQSSKSKESVHSNLSKTSQNSEKKSRLPSAVKDQKDSAQEESKYQNERSDSHSPTGTFTLTDENQSCPRSRTDSEKSLKSEGKAAEVPNNPEVEKPEFGLSSIEKGGTKVQEKGITFPNNEKKVNNEIVFTNETKDESEVKNEHDKEEKESATKPGTESNKNTGLDNHSDGETDNEENVSGKDDQKSPKIDSLDGLNDFRLNGKFHPKLIGGIMPEKEIISQESEIIQEISEAKFSNLNESDSDKRREDAEIFRSSVNFPRQSFSSMVNKEKDSALLDFYENNRNTSSAVVLISDLLSDSDSVDDLPYSLAASSSGMIMPRPVTSRMKEKYKPLGDFPNLFPVTAETTNNGNHAFGGTNLRNDIRVSAEIQDNFLFSQTGKIDKKETQNWAFTSFPNPLSEEIKKNATDLLIQNELDDIVNVNDLSNPKQIDMEENNADKLEPSGISEPQNQYLKNVKLIENVTPTINSTNLVTLEDTALKVVHNETDKNFTSASNTKMLEDEVPNTSKTSEERDAAGGKEKTVLKKQNSRVHIKVIRFDLQGPNENNNGEKYETSDIILNDTTNDGNKELPNLSNKTTSERITVKLKDTNDVSNKMTEIELHQSESLNESEKFNPKQTIHNKNIITSVNAIPQEISLNADKDKALLKEVKGAEEVVPKVDDDGDRKEIIPKENIDSEKIILSVRNDNEKVIPKVNYDTGENILKENMYSEKVIPSVNNDNEEVTSKLNIEVKEDTPQKNIYNNKFILTKSDESVVNVTNTNTKETTPEETNPEVNSDTEDIPPKINIDEAKVIHKDMKEIIQGENETKENIEGENDTKEIISKATIYNEKLNSKLHSENEEGQENLNELEKERNKVNAKDSNDVAIKLAEISSLNGLQVKHVGKLITSPEKGADRREDNNTDGCTNAKHVLIGF